MFSHQKREEKQSSPASRERLIRGYTKFDFTVDEGKGRLNPFRDTHYRKHRSRRKVEKSCVTFRLFHPGWCVHVSNVQIEWNGKTHTTHKHTYHELYKFKVHKFNHRLTTCKGAELLSRTGSRWEDRSLVTTWRMAQRYNRCECYYPCTLKLIGRK